jgi:ABC-type sugar transport system ATPase subunit
MRLNRDDDEEKMTATHSGSAPLLAMKGIRKAFPGVVAVSSASFELLPGEIHALVGENGAGKSTLIKILTGVHRADAGEIILFGSEVVFTSPLAARRAGIAAIYQEFTLVPTLTVAANLFLGRERTRRGLIDAQREHEQANELFKKLGVVIDPDALVQNLNVAQQQLVEIARALATDARILVMDEPTAALTPNEVEKLFVLLHELAARNIGTIFISHRLDEVFKVADRVTIMRDGKTIATAKAAELNRNQLIELMVGRPLESEFPKLPARCGDVCLEVRNLSGGKVKNVSFQVKRGEVLGMAGLMGAGRTEVARLIFGADPRESGEICVDGKDSDIESPREAIANGICLLTEDRKSQGLVLKATAKDNFALPNLESWSRVGFIDEQQESKKFAKHVIDLNIRIAGPDQLAEELSGGNQQKLLVARWLETNSQVIVFDEPTRGIDVGAKYEMYLLINDLAARGKAIIVISSELPELLGICDRIMVMREGRIAGEISDVRAATQTDIMALAT